MNCLDNLRKKVEPVITQGGLKEIEVANRDFR